MLAVWTCGIAACVASLFLPPLQGDTFPLSGILLAAVLAAFAGSRKVHLLPSAWLGEKAFITLGHLITVAALLAYGTRAAVVVGIASATSGSLYPRRLPGHKVAFNVATVVTAAWLSGQVFYLLSGGIPHILNLRVLWALTIATLVYYLVNCGCVVGIIALCSGQNVVRVWRQNFLWVTPSYFAGASCALVAQHFFRSDARMLLLALPILGFIYQFYRSYSEKIDQKERYIEELQAGRDMLADLYLSTVKSLAIAIDAKDQNTHAHIHRVQRYALAIADQLGVTGDALEAVKTGALLHDIGKLGVPDYVLLKPGPLTDEEFEKMKRHPSVGADILEPVNFPWPVADVVRHHHERWDGKGYPDGLAGEAIPLGARILSVADVYDAVTSDRPYRPAWPKAKALDFLRTHSGANFDPKIVEAFLQVTQAEQAEQELQTQNPAREPIPALEVTHQIRRTASELWTLYEVAQTLRSSQEKEARLEQLATKIAASLPDTVCAFVLRALATEGTSPALALEGKGGTGTERVTDWIVWCAEGTSRTLASGLRLCDVDALSTRVARTHHVYRGLLAEGDLFDLLPLRPLQPMQSALLVPLIHRGELLGTLGLYHPEPDAFIDDDEQLLTRIAEQVQSALYHDMLLDKTRSDAMTDSLTGLYNTRYLLQTLEPVLCRQATEANEPYALLYLDLDNFKPINDTFGHMEGDGVLRDFARLLKRELRPSDLIIRYGGDEFVIVLFRTGENLAAQIAGRIRHAVTTFRPGLVHPTVGELRLEVSIGIAISLTDGNDLSTLIAIADRRMFDDKTAHKIQALAAPVPAAVPPGDLEVITTPCLQGTGSDDGYVVSDHAVVSVS